MKAKCLPKCTLEVCSAKKQLYAPLPLWTICYKNLTAAWSAKEKCGKVTFMTCRIFRPRGCSLLLCYLRALPSALSAREMFLPKVIYLRKFIASPHWCATYSHIILTCVLPFFFLFTSAVCAECKATWKLLLTRKSRALRMGVQLSKSQALAQRFKLVKQKVVHLSNRTTSLKSKLSAMVAKNANICKGEFVAKIAGLPRKQREAVHNMLRVSPRQSTCYPTLVIRSLWVSLVSVRHHDA